MARLALIAIAAAVMIGGIVALDRASAQRHARAEPQAEVRLVIETEPIADEAGVFRTSLDLAELTVERRTAHPRTLATFRTLRAYPGAPPRIPHGLTRDELRETSCRTCHERGGFAPRFNAYAPVTPHPELSACTQCHLADDALLDTPLPARTAAVGCRQCHAPNSITASPVELDWHAAAWPAIAPRGDAAAPPPIPHDLALRGNCVACHAGPGAVADIRTSHPERADCRQCHVTADPDVMPFSRPTTAGVR